MHACSRSCQHVNPLDLSPLSPRPSAQMVLRGRCSLGSKFPWSKTPLELPPHAYNGISGNQLRLQPCLHMCVPTKFSEPMATQAMLLCGHADNDEAMVDPYPSLHTVLTMGLLWQTQALSRICPQLWPGHTSGLFGLYPHSHSPPSPLSWSLDSQHAVTGHTNRHAS